MLKYLKATREFTENLKLIKPSLDDEANIEEINQNMDTIDKFTIKAERLLGEMETNKLDRGGFLGTAKNLSDEISKIASTTQFGRIKVGTNLQMDENGFLHGNPAVDISGKLDKGNVAEKYNTAEKIGIELDKKQNFSDSGLNTNAKTIVGGINEIEQKFKNFCPFPINSLFLTLGTENPATLFLGTTWQKQEGRFLLGSSSTYAIGSTGGNSTIILTEANMPRHRHQVDTISATIPEHIHSITLQNHSGDNYSANRVGWGADNLAGNNATVNTSSAGGGSTGAIAPYTSYIGNGTPFNNMPPYLVCNVWKRLT